MTHHLGELTHNLRERYRSITVNEVFPNTDPPYQELIMGVREWKKTDIHCHISNSLKAEFIWHLYYEKNESQKKEIAERAQKMAQGSGQKMLPSAWDSPQSLSPYVTSSSHEECFTYKSEIRDLPIITTQDFQKAVTHVAEQCFQDGVTYLELRFNPYKKELCGLTGLSDERILEGAVRAVYNGLVDAENEFNGCRTGMTFSFNRKKFENCPDKLVKIVELLGKIKKEHGDISKRMIGIDLSGPKQELNALYKKALHKAREYSFIRTAHFDARRMTLQGQYEPIEEGINHIEVIIDELDRIGHGLSLSPLPTGLEGQIDTNGRLYDGNRVNNIQKSLEILWNKIKDRHIVIECCPSTNLRSHNVKDYQSHPFHFWAENGFDLGLGIDGLWFWPSTLSEEIARLLISSPYNISVEEMQRIASNRP